VRNPFKKVQKKKGAAFYSLLPVLLTDVD